MSTQPLPIQTQPKWLVQAPDGKVIQFPDNFTDADVTREMSKMYGAPAKPPGPIARLQQKAVDVTNKAASGFGEMFGVDPNRPVMGTLENLASPILHPVDTATAIGSELWNNISGHNAFRAGAELRAGFQKGETGKGALRAASDVIPFGVGKGFRTIAEGETARGAGQLAGGATQALLLKKTPEVAGAATEVVKHPLRTMAEIGSKPEVAQSLVAEAKNLPLKAVSGAEDIFRAAAPTGMKGNFRANVYTAAGDLAEIGNKIDLEAARGGIHNPDFRPRATVQAITDHLKEMYQQERAPQIARNAQNPVDLRLTADAKEALSYLAETAGNEQARGLAARAVGAKTIPLADADALAMLVNQELLPFEKLSPAKRMQAGMTSRKIGGFKELDKNVTSAVNRELQNRGEVGVTEYERRYAALSQVRDQFQSRMNAVELDVSKGKVIRPAMSLVTGGKSGIASASQAAVADVNIGRMLESGFRKLRESGLKANRGVAPQARPIAGLLGPARRTIIPENTGGLARIEGRPYSEPPVTFLRRTRKMGVKEINRGKH